MLQVMMLLHELFSKYDNLCSQYGVYKVETIGDCYMACCGLLTEDPDHAAHLVQFGQAILAVAAGVTHPTGGTVRIRVGIHSGRVMSGVVGSIRARYCLFGDTVNTASRMESTGVVDHIQVSLQEPSLVLVDMDTVRALTPHRQITPPQPTSVSCATCVVQLM
jgi:class 3 adenylate cyclase